MTDTIQILKGFTKSQDFFVGIDSDGCAFDTMEIKHKECFIPNTINSWGLHGVSRLARETAEFVNLYSEWRGINRFPALVVVLDLLAERPEVIERGYRAPAIDALREWIQRETVLSGSALRKEVARNVDPSLRQALEWSDAVNAAVERMVYHAPPFPHVRQCLEKLMPVADIMVVSATPDARLRREWTQHGIAKYARMIAGQEMGSKAEHIRHAAASKYDADKILMVGDAPGDLKAARANKALFFPINPGGETDSWKRFWEEGIDRFLAGEFRGAYEEKLVAEFKKLLPSVPPWKKRL